MPKRAAPYIVLAVLQVLGIGTAHSVEVRDVRLWAGPDHTRVVLELSGPATHNLFTLRNPDRVVVDVAGATASSTLSPPAGQGVIRSVRLGPRDDGSLRVVLDLNSAVQPKSFAVDPNETYGNRLVIDLELPGQPAPVKVQHAPEVDAARDLVIAVDAGHGGDDPGAIGRSGTREKDVVLAVARALAERMNHEPGMRAVLIRDGDYYITLRDRMNRARAQKADLFVSVHADSIRDRSIAGSSVYVLSPRGASDEAARWLAERENASDLIGGVSLDDKDNVLASVLLDLSQTASLTASLSAAQSVLTELDRVGEVRKHNVQQAGFVVLKSPDIPSLLVETAYISNPGEERRLKDPKRQDQLASAIHAGIRGYFYDNPPPGTRVAELVAQRNPPPDRKILAQDGSADVNAR
ncbi:MAG TPA: N-acetylmuramoyl-L-alanine amidase [Steroidobacteraceae bacterium]|jgi:N-acetylmuramoyl-L-alanine amidase|nr:N-acetylmuramoyl-L-alanine amidase [Steroidobacteraceae bacterium]